MPPYEDEYKKIFDDLNSYWEKDKETLDSDILSWYKDSVAEEKWSDDGYGDYKDYWTEYDKMKKRRLSAEERMQFAKERQAVIGSLITQKGEFCGALVKEHVRGSQYVVRLANGTEVFASHKKQREGQRGLSKGGWQTWEERS